MKKNKPRPYILLVKSETEDIKRYISLVHPLHPAGWKVPDPQSLHPIYNTILFPFPKCKS